MATMHGTVPVGRELTWLAVRLVLAVLAVTQLLPSLLGLAAAPGR